MGLQFTPRWARFLPLPSFRRNPVSSFFPLPLPPLIGAHVNKVVAMETERRHQINCENRSSLKNIYVFTLISLRYYIVFRINLTCIVTQELVYNIFVEMYLSFLD